MDKGKNDLDVFFARLATANLHYDAFGELLESPLPFLQVFDGTGHSIVSSYYGRYGQLVEGPPSVKTHKDHEEGDVDTDGNDYDGGDGQDGDGRDSQDGDRGDGQVGNGGDGQDGDRGDGQDDDGGDGQDGDGGDSQDGDSGNGPDVDPMKLGEAENGKSTSSIAGPAVEADKRVGDTTSALPVDVASAKNSSGCYRQSFW